MENGVDVRKATHVKVEGGRIERIVSKWALTAKAILRNHQKGDSELLLKVGAAC